MQDIILFNNYDIIIKDRYARYNFFKPNLIKKCPDDMSIQSATISGAEMQIYLNELTL